MLYTSYVPKNKHSTYLGHFLGKSSAQSAAVSRLMIGQSRSRHATTMMMTPHPRRRSRRLRSMTDSSLVSDWKEAIPHEIVVLRKDEEKKTADSPNSRTFRTESTCSATQNFQREKSQRLVRSLSLPSNLNHIMTTSSLISIQGTETLFIDENSTVSDEESFFTSSDDEETSTTNTNPDGSSSMNSNSSTGDADDDEKEGGLIASTDNLSPVVPCKDIYQPPSLMDLMVNQDWNAVEAVCEQRPELARHSIVISCLGEKLTALPLHLACTFRSTPLRVVDALVTAYPRAITQAEELRGRLPLHFCCCKGASPGIVRYLAQAMPSTLQEVDAQGNVPLHYASMYGTNQVVKLLLTANAHHAEFSCKISNAKSKLPLHVLCARWMDQDDSKNNEAISIETVKLMIQLYPGAVTTPDQNGRLPIHVACNMAHPRLDVIQLLLSYKAETILQKDSKKYTPLQLAKRFHAGSHDLHLRYLEEITSEERVRQQKKRAKRMARRLFHFGRGHGFLNNNNSNHSSDSDHFKIFNC